MDIKKSGEKTSKKIVLNKLPMMAWIIIPFIGVWFTTSYLLGIINRPGWITPADQNNPSAFAAPNSAINEIPPRPEFEWQGTGLVTFWFDDGWESQYTNALPILEKHNIKGSLAVPTHAIGTQGYMSWNQVFQIQQKGWEIDAHSRTHTCDLSKFSEGDLESELQGSKDDLNARGFRADYYVTPCGNSNQEMLNLTRKTFLALRTSEPGFNQLPLTDPYNLKIQIIKSDTSEEDVKKWVTEAKSTKTWLIMAFHQVESQEKSEYAISPAKLNSFIEIAKQSELPIVVPSQALEID